MVFLVDFVRGLAVVTDVEAKTGWRNAPVAPNQHGTEELEKGQRDFDMGYI